MHVSFSIFDCFRPAVIANAEQRLNFTYEKRKAILDEIQAKNLHGNSIRFLPAYEVQTQTDIDRLYEQFLAENFEGAILRRKEGLYTYSYNNYHSRDVLKLKPFFDAEYEITGFMDGKKGKDVGAIIWQCKANGEFFTVVPNLEYTERYRLFVELTGDPGIFEKKYKGKLYTVRYTTLSKDKIPQQPKGVAFRDDV